MTTASTELDTYRRYRAACRGPLSGIVRAADAAIAALQASERRGCTCYSRDEDCPLHGAWDAKNMRLRSKP